jgi:hypothetical protein
MRALIAALLLGPALACAPRPPAPPDVSQAEWTLSRERLARLRAEQPTRPYVERVRVAFVEPRTGRRYEGRGAVAVSPDHAARMMLVGPGGTTALDLWVTKERFRLAMPALDIERRGGTAPEEMKGLPVGMLRWWFLSPLDGRLLAARSNEEASSWLLRSGEATVMVQTDGRRFLAVRREGKNVEGIEWLGHALVPKKGSRGRYIDVRNGLRVEVLVEEVMGTEPDPAAFLDPDAELPDSEERAL